MPKKHNMGSYRHLSQADRDRLQALRDAGTSQEEIARILKVDPSTISREISRNRRKYRKKKNIKNKNARYEAGVAEHKAYLRRKYAKYQGKRINEDNALRRYIVRRIKRRWGPDEISGRMKRDREPFYASKTAIYEWLRTVYGQRWCPYLYSGRYYARRRKEKAPKKQMIPHRIGIEHRPLGATNRTRYGHYEGDTMVSGKKTGSKAALAVVYERKAKYLDARKISSLAPRKFTAGVNEMMQNQNAASISLDNGIENREHETIVVPGFFCDPYSSWQKGGVENGIKMIRRFIPKGVDLAQYSDDDVKTIIEILNGKPRKSLNYATPKEIMVERNLFTNKKSPAGEIALRGWI
ncbi:MAG: IS30 family transposase [Patescibacteria group bacterium]